MNTKDYMYSWHLSLRVDRPVEGCNMKPHCYMYGKKLDERDVDKPLPSHSKKMREPPPEHEFSYRWFRGPRSEPCAYEGCTRRTSFSPHDWSKHAIGGSGCGLQCVSTQSSLFKCTFCNSNCFVEAWKTQYTVPKDMQRPSRGTPMRKRTGSVDSMEDDLRSVGSVGSSDRINGGGGAKSPANFSEASGSSGPPGTPRGYLGGYNGGGAPGSAGPYKNGNHPQKEEEWIEVSREQFYVPGQDDIGRRLKLEAAAYSSETGELLMHRVVKTDLVLARAPDPVKRSLVTAKNGAGAGSGARFRIVSYNVLAEIYATQQQYPYCDIWALSWEYRFHNIMREIVDAAPDVICLQEVQADHYEDHIYAAMSEQGFEGVYKQKTRQSMGLAGKVDGCALFWRRTKFHLVESYSIEFNELAQRQATQVLGLNPRSEEGTNFLNRLSKDNIAQLVVLELASPQLATRTNRDPINQVCIANTHLYSNKEFPDVKLWQAWQLLQELENFAMSRGTSLPLMICGDFNSSPDSAVYDLLMRQNVHPGHPDVNINTGDDCPNVLPDAMNITHSFQLGSTYQSVLGEEPQQTNYTLNFKGVLDYICYSVQTLRPLSASPVPDESVLTRHGDALPSTEFSSDHIMLISDMQILNGGAR
ncbi:Exo_endo_phos-domain-containing protein [Fragilariopsis cylindrus CCMP1102]|uniref:Exo_endo_phos-domain-containing protein n=1 Tax=Fragilariopsis cylindrus CCMP1102 TaxID=635003 RepID=A0A1E7FFJ1_9STRA|nr:Exo_endo_phos-domain-containing protein [Fragilariopsis cylindrus CCMP1102]|eukprot:OEU16815.1 Exo_endo_phos-domain-containing protein [Fragilariopsis cylindrus CCMP1102]